MYIEIDSKDFLIKAMANSNLTTKLAKQDNIYFGTHYTEESFCEEVSRLYADNRNLVYIDEPDADFRVIYIAKFCRKNKVKFRLCPENKEELPEVNKLNARCPELTTWLEDK